MRPAGVMRLGAYGVGAGVDWERCGGSGGGPMLLVDRPGEDPVSSCSDPDASPPLLDGRESVGDSRCASDAVRGRFGGGPSLSSIDRFALDTLLRRPGLGGEGAYMYVGEARMLCLYDGVGGSGVVWATGEFSIASLTGSNMGIAGALCLASHVRGEGGLRRPHQALGSFIRLHDADDTSANLPDPKHPGVPANHGFRSLATDPAMQMDTSDRHQKG